MRICFVADANHPNTLNWAEYFGGDLGHEVHICSLNTPLQKTDCVNVHHLKSFMTNKLRYLLSPHALKPLVAQLSPDLLIGYRLTSYAYMAAKTGFHPLVVVAQSEKAAGKYRVIRKPAQWLAARYALKHADLALAWAPHIARDMVRLGCHQNRVLTLPRGVDLLRFQFRPYKARDELVLITTRALKPQYKLSVVVEALTQLRNQVKNLKYIVVGDGPERDRLTNLVVESRLENHVEFMGRVPYDSISKHLNRSHVYISPVPQDGVSSSLLEAMASGVFPLVTDIEANRYWQDLGGKLLFFKPQSVKDLVNNILEYHRNRHTFQGCLLVNRDIVEKRGSWVANMNTIEQTLLKLTDNN